MRVTQNFLTMKYLNGIQKNLGGTANGLESVTKGRNLLSPEQDPVKYISALSLQTTLDESAQFKRNAENALTWFQNSDNELQQASSLLSKALNEYAIYGANDSHSAESRKALAGDVLGIINNLIAVGNANYNGRYIFSGHETHTQPFQSQERSVSSVVSNINGGDAMIQKLYGDMPELKEGTYTVKASVSNGIVNVEVFDKFNKRVLIDTNGTDEAGANGNNASYTLTTKYTEGMVINTGTGVGIKMPETDMEGRTFSVNFAYKPGDNVNYYGDDGIVTTKIGYSQDVDINMTGQQLFMETYKTLRGTVTNKTNGLNATEVTYFSNLDGANTSISDSISIRGTDHNGFKVGIAKLLAPSSVDLDMSAATDAERTLTLRYADEDFSLTLDKKGYKNIDEVVFELNRKLENQGLANEISAVNDGDRVMFVTSRAGDNVKLELRGSANNKLGFPDPTPTDVNDFTYSAVGKDTTFEIGFSGYDKPVVINYQDNSAIGGTDNRANFTVGENQIFVNGVAVKFNVSATDTAEDIQKTINAKLKENGFAFTVTAKVEGTADANRYNLELKLHNVNYDKNTQLTAKVDTAGGTDYQTANARNGNFPAEDEKRLSDFATFIENLYDNAVDASFVDGRLVVQDLRSGSSRLTFNVDENNTGIGYPMLEQTINVSGKYTGTKDDKWMVNLTVQPADPAVPGDYNKILLETRDINGNMISTQTINKDTYFGQPISLSKGVYITLGQTTNSTSFALDLKKNTNISFGDINVVEEGSNVDTFRALTNLYNALNLNVTQQGIGAPSAWKDTSLNSTAVPYFDGTFRGNYNDLFNFEVMATGDKSELFVQSELKSVTSPLKYTANSDIDFDITVKDGNSIYTRNVFIDRNEIFNGLTSPLTGTEAARLNFSRDAGLSFYYQDGGVWKQSSISIPAGNYASTADLVSTINTLTPAGITASANGDGTISFSEGGTVSNINVAGDIHGAIGFANFTPEQLITDRISEIVSTDSTLASLNVRAYNNSGVLEIFSGKGTREISINANNEGTTRTFFQTVSPSLANTAAALDFTTPQVLELTYYDTTADTWSTATVTIPPSATGKYEDLSELIASATGLPAGITLGTDNSGKLSFSAAAPLTHLSVSDNTPVTGAPEEQLHVLGFVKNAPMNSIVASAEPKLFLAGATTNERTMSFSYNDGTKKTASITIEAKDYANIGELMTEINSKLSAQGLNNSVQAVIVDGGKLAFTYDDTAVTDFHVSGSNEASLGFYKAGSEAQIKVTGHNGELIGYYKVDTANQLHHVADGVNSGFNVGYLYATDSFTTGVGSGIDYELPVLSRAENQITNSLTTVGTRQNRVETSINYYTVMSTTNEEIKAGYIGATAADQTAAITAYQLALQAYETSLQASARIMGISLLDFL